jgi:hypothetical protein
VTAAQGELRRVEDLLAQAELALERMRSTSMPEGERMHAITHLQVRGRVKWIRCCLLLRTRVCAPHFHTPTLHRCT